MTRGTLFLVVGPSGAGKDTLIAEVLKHRPDLHHVKRTITRPVEPIGELHIPMDMETFAAHKIDNNFALSWDANGYRYGVGQELQDRLNSGQSAILNGSRTIVTEARRLFDPIKIIHVTARLDDLSRRLRARGREDEAAIERRLARATRNSPTGNDVVTIDNSGPLEDGVKQFLAAVS